MQPLHFQFYILRLQSFRSLIPSAIRYHFKASIRQYFDDLCSANTTAFNDLITHLFQSLANIFWKGLLYIDLVRQPLVVKLGFVNGIFRTQVKIDDINYGLKN